MPVCVQAGTAAIIPTQTALPSLYSRGVQVLAWQAVSLTPRREFPLPETPRSMALVPGDADASGGSAGPKVKTGPTAHSRMGVVAEFLPVSSSACWWDAVPSLGVFFRSKCIALPLVVSCYHVRVDTLLGSTWGDQVYRSMKLCSLVASRSSALLKGISLYRIKIPIPPPASPVHVPACLSSWYFPYARSIA